MSDFFSLPAGITPPAVSLPTTLDDADIARQAPAVRGQLLRRLEHLYGVCEDMVADVPDPRWAELAVRILDREAKLYRLDVKGAPADEEVDAAGVDEFSRRRLRSIVSTQLDELADRAQ